MEKRLFAVIMVVLLSLSILAVLRINVAEAASYLTLSDVELGTEFAYGWGPGGSNVTNHG